MQKHLRALETITERLQASAQNRSIILNGSVAYGNADDASDLDLLVLCDWDGFESSSVEGIMAEIHFHRFDTLLARLHSKPMEVYRYLYAKVIRDDGNYAVLAQRARELYQSYRTPVQSMEKICYWLSSTEQKLLAALRTQNDLRTAYLLSTNTWKVLEGLYALNHKPVPPSGLAFHLLDTLDVPVEQWQQKLLLGTVETKAETMLRLIRFICRTEPEYTIRQG